MDKVMRLYIIFAADVQKVSIAKLIEVIINAANNGIPELYIAISSSGGLIQEGLTAASIIKSLSINVITHNITQTDSAANLIFTAGKERYANSNATFLFHEITNALNKPATSSQLLEESATISRGTQTYISTISDYTGIVKSEIFNLMHNGESVLNASDALKMNIIHEVKEFSIPLNSAIVSIGNI